MRSVAVDKRSPPVLAIDGPAGVGKGTVSQIVAERLGWHYLDSGAVYRALALEVKGAGISPEDMPAVCRLARDLQVDFRLQTGGQPRVLLDGRDVSDAVRTEKCGDLASRLATSGEVRRELLGLQRRLRRAPGLVADGRDMGAVVFPDAVLKIYLTATPEVRAKRRYKQLKEKGLDVNLPRLILDIRERDVRDMQRTASPLTPTEDAHQLDTSAMSVGEVVAGVLRLLRERHHRGKQNISC